MRDLITLFFHNLNFFKNEAITTEIYHELKITSILEFYYQVNS